MKVSAIYRVGEEITFKLFADFNRAVMLCNYINKRYYNGVAIYYPQILIVK